MRRYAPISKTVSAAFGAFSIVLVAEWGRLDGSASSNVLFAFALGALYTHLVEYWFHRIPMHRGVPFLENIKTNHQDHHRVFHGDHFRTRRAEELVHVPGRWFVFPPFFLAHYFVLSQLLGAQETVAFLAGAVGHYVAFELTHWFTHLEDNAFDRFIARVPVLAGLRAYQIHHHQIHHERPDLAFNFNPPYLGDLLTGRMPRGIELAPHPAGVGELEPVEEVPSPSALRRFPAAVMANPWRRRVLWYGSAGAAALTIFAVVFLAHGRSARSKWFPTSVVKT